MTQSRPHPDLWYPIAQLLVALRTLLRATAPESFIEIARHARTHLAALTALARRYIHVLAAEIVLPPPRAKAPPAEGSAPETSARGTSRYLFPLIEAPARPSRPCDGEDPLEIQWARLMEAVTRLAEVLARPERHARRLTRRFGTLLIPGLRELPVRGHVLRRLPPEIDVLLMRLDQAARPLDWAGLDSS